MEPIPHPIFNDGIYRILLSSPTSTAPYKKVEILQNATSYQASMFTKTQVFHKNLAANQLKTFVEETMRQGLNQYTAWDNARQYAAKLTKKGKLLTSSTKNTQPPKAVHFAEGTFNKQKNHIIPEGQAIPALVDMGIFTKDNKVAAPMQHKFQQINRFIELIADKTTHLPQDRIINIVDFGCGKSYLTFLVYHYFAVMERHPVHMCGLDLNPQLVADCNATAQKYGYQGLSFTVGDIGGQDTPPLPQWGCENSFDIIISLHACNTATDHALYHAITWEADLICAAPCCQHELRSQMQPKTLGIFSSYGMIEERMAALMTDAIRAKLLEHMGYTTQIIEFTDMEHTAKNLLIRATRGKKNPHALAAVRALVEEFAFSPTLMRLLGL